MKSFLKSLTVAIILIITALSVAACGKSFEGAGYNEYYQTEDEQEVITVMSYNIRYNTKEYWKQRVEMIGLGVEKVSPDILGMQEVVMERQLEPLKSVVGDGYGCVAYGRDENDKGEACAIFYKKERFDLLQQGVFWLSKTPDVVSRYDGAGHNRTCAFVKLYDKVTGKELVYYNTHLDNSGVEARAYGINLILQHMASNWAQDMPKILTGDFNFYEGEECYDDVVSVMNDAKFIAADSDEGLTWHDYKGGIEGKPIDFCMLSKDITDVKSYKIIRTVSGRKFASDHYAITVKLKLAV